jgi:hypothetical protein
LGARERSDALVKRIVIENDDPWVPLLIERQSGETQLFAKLRGLDRLQHERIRYRDNDWLVHRCLQADSRSIPPRPHRAAAARQATWRRQNLSHPNIRSETPRSSQAWCHVVMNFAESGVILIDYRNQVFK